MNAQTQLWSEKPYYSLNYYCKQQFHEKLYKIALNAGLTCPNRDGTLGTRGCIFCSEGGSGEFSVDCTFASIQEQLAVGLSLFHDKKTGSRYIAYFQAYTNTYGPVSYLEKIYREALSCKDIAGISIATRPDCLGTEVLSLLSSLTREFPDKFIWVELGLQTIHQQTAVFIRRGYPLSVFEEAVFKLQGLSIPVVVHVILGLPGETGSMLLETIQYLNKLHVFGIKLQLLHILKNTDLALCYEQKQFSVLSEKEYLDLLILCIRHLSPDIVIHRLTGDGPRELLIAPVWSLNKRHVLNALHREMKLSHIYQGMDYHPDTNTVL